MSGDFLLDTNIIIPLVEGDPTIAWQVAKASRIFLPCITIGELHYGAAKSKKAAENARRADEYASRLGVLPCDVDTARIYGRVRWQLRAKGKPIPENDIWIAAIAIQHDLPLVSRDEHFKEIEGLLLLTW